MKLKDCKPGILVNVRNSGLVYRVISVNVTSKKANITLGSGYVTVPIRSLAQHDLDLYSPDLAFQLWWKEYLQAKVPGYNFNILDAEWAWNGCVDRIRKLIFSQPKLTGEQLRKAIYEFRTRRPLNRDEE